MKDPLHHPLKNKSKSRSFERITHIPLFTALSPSASSTSSIVSSSSNSLSPGVIRTHHIIANIDDSPLLKRVQQLHSSNLICCDCGSSKTVDWISINLLCVLCIKCSGVHRSLGTHVSKVRSLTLDSFKDIELRYLIKHNLRNDLVNEIYEELMTKTEKINSNATDLQRSKFINEKYLNKKFVNDSNLDYNSTLKLIIKGIHNENINFLQIAIAKSKLSLRKLSQEYDLENENDPTKKNNISLFKYSLKHNIKKDSNLIFNITEFLLINDILIDTNIPTDLEAQKKWPHEALEYWNNKLDIYGDTFLSIKSNKQQTNTIIEEKQLPSKSNNHTNNKKRGNSIKRWSLASIPKAPQNIISMHKSLKRKKDPTSNQIISSTTATIASPPSVP
ncbi:similar to Saccharomyces cerevisiae YDR524C AGE1 ADP-ribosylation factor (ARF) GTPase activating protein (GAP) effector, involved in the secretory and endocytic pathways [Maudiozyma saulgeensis]|uniref:ADP-ribosylation factor GTPase-activating protein n=1 Tax=Maudiozyma saulgeensis TaxID=1789683 RepID=A0A1X7R6T7_9SACH|nr:similar to Saccharomyces cerevisiae YDR524C AGE1 ADP-ribosylation factor (ARF) GTPase activating protein (GAP) effector, involved in the secretory and endocytic pathways [Kazachstania saulgeensis]